MIGIFFTKVLINLGRYYMLLDVIFNSILWPCLRNKEKGLGEGRASFSGVFAFLVFLFFGFWFSLLGAWCGGGHCHGYCDLSSFNTIHKSRTSCQLELDVKVIVDLDTLEDLLSYLVTSNLPIVQVFDPGHVFTCLISMDADVILFVCFVVHSAKVFQNVVALLEHRADKTLVFGLDWVVRDEPKQVLDAGVDCAVVPVFVFDVAVVVQQLTYLGTPFLGGHVIVFTNFLGEAVRKVWRFCLRVVVPQDEICDTNTLVATDILEQRDLHICWKKPVELTNASISVHSGGHLGCRDLGGKRKAESEMVYPRITQILPLPIFWHIFHGSIFLLILSKDLIKKVGCHCLGWGHGIQ